MSEKDRPPRGLRRIWVLALPPTLAALHAVMTFGAAAASPESTLRPWHEYRVIMWMSDSVYRQPEKLPLVCERLRAMGVNAGLVYGDANPQPIVRAGLPYYGENMVNRGLCLKWNAKVSNWDPFVTAWHKTRDEASLVREYCFDDPSWQSWAQKEVSGIVQKNRGVHPIAYDLRDELSVTISANPFDYDFSAAARQGFHLPRRVACGSCRDVNSVEERDPVTRNDEAHRQEPLGPPSSRPGR